MKRLLLAAVLSFVPALAWAQSTHDFPTTNQGERVPGTVTMCLNAQGQAVPATAAGTCLGTGGSATAVTVSPGACTTTQTIVSGTTGTLIAANTSRKELRWMNVGAADVTVAPGTTPPASGQGMVYAASGAAKQGGSESYYDTAVPTNAFAYSAGTTATIAVWECQ